MSIQEYGFKNPIIVDKDMIIIAGHTRYKAAKKLGLNEVPTIVVEDLDYNQVRALRIADNKTSEYADWDFEMLVEELGILKELDFNLGLTGFETADLEKLLNENKDIVDDDFNLEENLTDNPVSKKGDVWLLGRHRLVCGDSTLIDDVEKLMDGNKANLVVTDPPYNVNYEGGTKEKLKIQNDNMDNDSFYQFLIACEQTNRICYTMELDEKYVDVIIKRYYHNFPEQPIYRNGILVNPQELFNNS